MNKYKVAPPRELKSKFQQDQKQKIQQARQASLVKQQKAKGLNEVRVKGLEHTDYDMCMFVCCVRDNKAF